MIYFKHLAIALLCVVCMTNNTNAVHQKRLQRSRVSLSELQSTSFLNRHWKKFLIGVLGVGGTIALVLLWNSRKKRSNSPLQEPLPKLTNSKLPEWRIRLSKATKLPPLVEKLQPTADGIRLSQFEDCVSSIQGKGLRITFNLNADGDGSVRIRDWTQSGGDSYDENGRWSSFNSNGVGSNCKSITIKRTEGRYPNGWRTHLGIFATQVKPTFLGACSTFPNWCELVERLEVSPEGDLAPINNETMCRFVERIIPDGPKQCVKQQLTVNFDPMTKAATFDFVEGAFNAEELNEDKLKAQKTEAESISVSASDLTKRVFQATFSTG